jgi:hypothetical protein
MTSSEINDSFQAPKSNGWKTFGITVIVIAVLFVAFWLIKSYFFPDEFKPVTLSSKETRVLNQKLDQLNLPVLPEEPSSQNYSQGNAQGNTQVLQPEAYSEVGAKREVIFTEREINAMLAHNTDMADKLAIDLSDNLASAKLLMPLDPEMPIFGGRTLNLNAGIELAFGNGKPVVKLRGVSAWGVPIPNAWLGNVKNIDLVNEFGDGGGFWQAFADGIEFMKVSEGKLVVKLKE